MTQEKAKLRSSRNQLTLSQKRLKNARRMRKIHRPKLSKSWSKGHIPNIHFDNLLRVYCFK